MAAAIWTWLLQHSEVLAALLGAVVGGVFGSLGTVALTWWQNSQSRRIAKMQVATRLRHWANEVHSYVSDARTYDDSRGCGGQYRNTLPDLLLERELGHVASLDGRVAERIFDLIHHKDSAHAKIQGAQEYGDEDEALDAFRGEGAKLYIAAVDLYNELAASLGWASDTFKDSAKASMRAEHRRLEDSEAERAREAAAYWESAQQT